MVFKRIVALLLRFQKHIAVLAIFLAVVSIAAVIILPPVLKNVLTKKLGEELNRPVAIRQIILNPFALSVTVKGVEIKEKGSPQTFASFDELYVNLESVSIFKGGLVLREISLVRPYVNVKRNSDLTYNFSDLLEKKGPPKKESKPFKFSFNNISIKDGTADFDDGPKKVKHKVTDVNLTVPFVSNLDYYTDTYVKPSFSAKVNGRPVELKGETKIFAGSRETKFNIDLENFNIPHYLAYVPVKMGFTVPSGLVDVKASITYKQFTGDKKPLVALYGDVALKDFAANINKNEQVIRLPRVDVSIISVEPFTKKVKLQSVVINSPSLNVVRDAAGKLNLLSMLGEGSSSGQPKPAENGGDKLSLDISTVRLKDGKVSFTDYAVPGTFKAAFQGIDLTVVNFNNEKDWRTSIELALGTDAGESVRFSGGVVLDPLASDGKVEVGNIPLNRYSPYYRDALLLDVIDGSLGLSTSFSYAKGEKEPEVRLTDLSAGIKSLVLKKRGVGREFFKLPELKIKGVSCDLAKREVILGEVTSRDASLDASRLKDGSIDLASLVNLSAKKSAKAPAKPGKPWDITVKSVTVDSWAFNFIDQVPAEPVSVSVRKLRFTGENLSTIKNSKGMQSLFLAINRNGSIAEKGTISINPLAANLKVTAKGVEIAPFQPYFTDKVRIIIADGDISAGGSISVSQNAGKFRAAYKGDVSLNSLKTFYKENADEFLSWDSLFIKGIDAGYNPGYARIKEVALSDFMSKLVINQDGSLNVQSIVVREEKPKVAATAQPHGQATTIKPVKVAVVQPAPTPAPAKKDAFPVSIEKVTVQGGHVNFTDRSIKPNYIADLTEMAGRVTGLSSEATKMADLDLKCMFNNYAPLEITGRINPLREDLFVDIKARFTDVDLSPLTPYSGKYAGYTIKKGKLSLDLKYLIDKKKLDSSNVIFLDQFTFGERVESEKATKLPVKLAIALLKDRKGEIHLDLPVTGRTDDPKFRIGGLIIQVILNILSKAATSPFALLGAIFGGGEELGYMEFDYGKTDLGEAGTKKLGTLAKALSDRPALKLSIEGHVDVEKDKEALRQIIFNRKVKAQKLKDMISEGAQAVPVDDVNVAPAEYEKYLRMAYKAEKFPKPRNIIGFAKKLPVPDMEKLMLTHTEVTDSDLRMLASQRAEKVKSYLIGTGKVEAERVFMVEPKKLPPEKKDSLKDSRAVFILE